MLSAVVGLAWDLKDTRKKLKSKRLEKKMVEIHEGLYQMYRGLWETSGEDNDGKWWGNYNLVFRDGALECRVFGDIDREGLPKEAGFRWSIMGSAPQRLNVSDAQEKLLKYLATYLITEKKDVHKYYKILKEKGLV